MLREITLKKMLSWVLCIYFLFWMLVPALFSASFPLDVPEGIYWGKEFQLGYYKHPPFSSWVLYGFYFIFGVFGPYILSQLCIALTLYLVYLLARHIISAEKSILAAYLVLGIYYYTWPSIEFNHNVAQMPIWAGLIYLFYLVLKKNTWVLWFIFGGVMGIGMLTKYSIAILIGSMVLFSLITPYKTLWLTAKPWLAVGVAVLMFSPHVWWLYQHDWLTFNYIQSRSHEDGDTPQRLEAFKFLLSQIVNFLPLLVILLCAKCLKFYQRDLSTSDGFYLLFMGAFPALSLFLFGLITGVTIKDMWASPMWCLIPLILLFMVSDAQLHAGLPRIFTGLGIWLSLISILMAVYVQFGGKFRNKPSRMDWPQIELSERVHIQWKSKSQCDLDNIGGDNWLAILSATGMKNMPSVMMDSSEKYSSWMNLARLHQHGSIMLWEKGKHPILPYFFNLERDEQLEMFNGEWNLAWTKVPNKAPLQVEWYMFVPKQCLK